MQLVGASNRGLCEHDSFEINAVGGVSSPTDAAALLGLGATTVQLFTALVYQGPSLVMKIISDPEVRRAVDAKRNHQWRERFLRQR